MLFRSEGDTGIPASTVSQNNGSRAECGRRVCFPDNDIAVDHGTEGHRRCDTVPKCVLFFTDNANVGHENLESSSGTSPGLHINQYVPDYDEFPPLESSTNLSPMPKGHIPDSALGLEQMNMVHSLWLRAVIIEQLRVRVHRNAVI